jgi:proteasome alpha subunit
MVEMPVDMQHQMMGYDRAATMFSPEGHILQAEYAEKTVRLGSASIGVVCKDGIVVIADKRIKDKLIVPESANKVYEIDEHIAGSAAGILSDARILIERAQLTAQQHRVTYDSPIDMESVIKDIANAMQAFTQYPGARPFGVSIMIAGINSEAQLFVSEVTGNYIAYKATAIGENDEKLKEELRKKYNDDITIEEAIKLSLKIFKDVLGKNFDLDRFDVGYIEKSEKKLKRISGEKLKKYLK